jgi:hypothetical protein
MITNRLNASEELTLIQIEMILRKLKAIIVENYFILWVNHLKFY